MRKKATEFRSVLIALLLLGGGILSVLPGGVRDVRGLVISTVYRISSDTTIDEDITINAGGNLIVDPGVTLTMGSGRGIDVIGGTLTLVANGTWYPFIRGTGTWGSWKGIRANENAVVLIEGARIQSAVKALECIDTGGTGTTGMVRVVNSSLVFLEDGIDLSSDVRNGPFDCNLKGNQIYAADGIGIGIYDDYDGVVAEDNLLWSADHAIEVGFVKDTIVRNNYAHSSRAGFYSGFVQGCQVYNNTFIDCDIGIFCGIMDTLSVYNNSIIAVQKGMYLGSINHLDVQNNSVNQFDDLLGVGMEIAVEEALVANNVVTAHGESMRINGSGIYEVRDNLITDLSAPSYIDGDGDGLCDSDPLLPGTAGVTARRCRTCIRDPSGTDMKTYVSPRQVCGLGSSGVDYVIDTFGKGYGAQDGATNMLFFHEQVVIDRPIGLIGDRFGSVNYYPVDLDTAMSVVSTDNVTIENFDFLAGGIGVRVIGSRDVRLAGLHLEDWSRKGMRGILIEGSDRVLLKDAEMGWMMNYPLWMDTCRDITITNLSVSMMDTPGIVLRSCKDVNGDDIYLGNIESEGVTITDCADVSLNAMDIASFRECVLIDNSPDVNVSDSDLWMYGGMGATLRASNSTGLRIAGCGFDGWNSDEVYTEVLLEGDSTDTLIERCEFHTRVNIAKTGWVDGVVHDGDPDGLIVRDCRFVNVSTGVWLRNGTIPSVHIDPSVIACSFKEGVNGVRSNGLFGSHVTDCEFRDSYDAIHSTATGEMRIVGCVITNSTIAIASSGDTTVRECSINGTELGVMFSGPGLLRSEGNHIENADQCIYVYMGRLESSGDFLHADNISVHGTFMRDSIVKDGILKGPVPVRMGLTLSPTSQILLDNCTGDPSGTDIYTVGCYANWTWPLRVSVADEVGDPQPCEVEVISSWGEVIFSDPIDGELLLPRVLGLSQSFDLSDHSMSEHTVRVSEGDHEDHQITNVSEPRHVMFRINHDPYLTGLAPNTIRFDEDDTYTVPAGDWFEDRDDLAISLKNYSEGIDGVIDDGQLTIWGDDDFNGPGWVLLEAIDTFGANVSIHIDVVVDPVNDGPILLKEIPEITVAEDGTTWLNLSGHAFDIDGDELAWWNGTVENCTVTWDGANMTISPLKDFFGLVNITLILSDGTVEIPFVLAVKVTPVNDPPVWTGHSVFGVTVTAGEKGSLDISEWIYDADTPIGSIALSEESPNVTVEGRVLQFLYPRNTKNMTESVQVTISDGEDLTGFVLEITVVEVPAFHPTWNVSDPRVIIDPRTGNWTVSVKGGEGQEIWVVIPGVGSFRMEEVSPGEYSVTIPGSEFKDGEVYSYHFSDRDGGPDLAPGLGGSMTQPDLDEDDRPSLLWLYLVIALVLVVLILAGFFAYGFIRKDRNLAYDDDVWEE